LLLTDVLNLCILEITGLAFIKQSRGNSYAEGRNVCDEGNEFATSILYTTVDLASIVGFPRENSFHSTPNTDKEALFIDVIYVFARNIVFFDYFLELTAGQTIS